MSMVLKKIMKKIPQIDRLINERNLYYRACEELQQVVDEKQGIVDFKENEYKKIMNQYSNLEQEYRVLLVQNEQNEGSIQVLQKNISELNIKNATIQSSMQLKLEQAIEETKKLKLENENLVKKQKEIKDFKSKDFWENHYKNGFNSGTGSYNHLAEFKAQVINNFIEENLIQDVIEFGCGDGNQLSLMNYKEYVGVDVSETIIQKNKIKFSSDRSKKFYTTNESEIYLDRKYDLSLSLDVIFHLNEDDVYERYMDNLFASSNQYVIIYSSNHEEFTEWLEFRNRKFMRYVHEKFGEWMLVEFIPNKYPFQLGYEDITSPSDFYIFKKGEDIG
ncbi:methyltransferase domain-containing protein [Paenibacillus sp. MMS20-IR301]|uniref:methyltransferase domain-containing protein n=1 Tax=Paenibacillus sp. MMS20-IR301 TaxID=2895946 RepID=UPI0028EF794E|nr:methyltransferase domain-containing protein [Paenibacillus sp. MMS20-IR301]WNS42736.1 methyltransferase domain-containing protein [Paenibacillus sp. MMS20-IR301]